MPRAPLLALSFAANHGKTGWLAVIEQLPNVVFEAFRTAFVTNGGRLLPGLAISPFSLAWLLDDLLHAVGGERYLAVRSDLTKVILSEALGADAEQMVRRIIFSLVETSMPARSGEIPVEHYRFNVNQSVNEARYDMALVKPVLANWTAPQGDRLAEKALVHLKREYGLT